MLRLPRRHHYGVIYADPPWTFATYSAKGKGRSPEAHYDCMGFGDICNIPVADWAAPDAVLLLWVTDPLLPKGLELIERWGFTYKTVGFYWAKQNRVSEGCCRCRRSQCNGPCDQGSLGGGGSRAV